MLITIGLDFPRPRILHQLPCNRARRNINLEINPTASSEKHRDAHLVCSLMQSWICSEITKQSIASPIDHWNSRPRCDSREAESRGRTSTNLRSVSGGTRICLGAFPGPFPFPSPNPDLSPFEYALSLRANLSFLLTTRSFLLSSSLAPSSPSSFHRCIYLCISAWSGAPARAVGSPYGGPWNVWSHRQARSAKGLFLRARGRRRVRERERDRKRWEERERGGSLKPASKTWLMTCGHNAGRGGSR